MPLVAELRGEGLLIGVGLAKPVGSAVVAAAMELGLIVNAPNEDSIRLAPPLIIGDAEVAEFVEKFARALTTANEAVTQTEAHT
jgi:acetylornithine aminotransferase